MGARSLVVVLVWGSILLGVFGVSPALAVTTASPANFTLSLSSADFGAAGITPEFSQVRNFSFDLHLAGPLGPGFSYGNRSLLDIEYRVSGRLDATPSGFPAFALDRSRGGREGSITPEDWLAQSSRLAFEISATANLLDGVQLSELVTNAKTGTLLVIDGREKGRLDVARYHPPQLLLYPDGTGLLWNSNNSSGGTGTTNPGSGLTVDLDFGDEYITHLRFDPAALTIIGAPPVVVPEPTTAVLLGLGLLVLTRARNERAARA